MRIPFLAPALLAWLLAAAGPAPAATILTPGESFELASARRGGETLWIEPADLPRVMGFELKPEGACRADICIPVREGSPDSLVLREGDRIWVSPTRLADRLGQGYVADAEAGVWSFAPASGAELGGLTTVEAPEFALPDRTGKTVRLSDFRGKKVLLITWASW